MNFHYCLNQLSVNAVVIQQLINAVDDEQAHWKPSAQDWSILEVINHLIDEEREDFRARLQHLFSGSVQPWPPIAPQDWVIERAYNHRDLQESIGNYLRERQRSLDWLGFQASADWAARYTHPPLKGIAAGDLLVSWAGHDLLHLRQIVELKWAHGRVQSGPYSAEYAGEW